MRFFFLRVLVNEATGNPQIVTTDPIYNYYDNKGIYEFTRTEFPEISDIKKLILDESAILNDILNIEMLQLEGLLVNAKVKSLLSSVRLPSHKVYPATVIDNDKRAHKYFWFQTGYDRKQNESLNIPKCQFALFEGVTSTDIEIASFEELRSKSKSTNSRQRLRMTKAVLKKSWDNLDIFKIGRFGLSSDWIISKRLKEALEQANVTGISIKPINNLEVAVR